MGPQEWMSGLWAFHRAHVPPNAVFPTHEHVARLRVRDFHVCQVIKAMNVSTLTTRRRNDSAVHVH